MTVPLTRWCKEALYSILAPVELPAVRRYTTAEPGMRYDRSRIPAQPMRFEMMRLSQTERGHTPRAPASRAGDGGCREMPCWPECSSILAVHRYRWSVKKVGWRALGMGLAPSPGSGYASGMSGTARPCPRGRGMDGLWRGVILWQQTRGRPLA